MTRLPTGHLFGELRMDSLQRQVQQRQGIAGYVSTKTPQTDNAAPAPIIALTNFDTWIQASDFLVSFQKEKAITEH